MLFYYQTSFLLGAISSALIALAIIFKGQDKIIRKRFAFLSLCGSIWSIGFYFLTLSSTEESALFWRWFMESGSVLLPAFWLHFVYAFLDIKNSKTKIIILVTYFFSAVVWVLNLLGWLYFPGIFESAMVEKYVFKYYAIAGFGYYLFFSYFSLVILYSLFILYKELKNSDGVKAIQIKYILVSAILGFAGGGMTFLPTIGISIQPYGVILFAIYPIIIAAAITRYHLFDIKVITVETLTFFIWLLILFQVLTTESFTDKIINGFLLLFAIIFGVLLIRTIIKEVQTRERIEGLVKDLAKANDHLRQMEQQKSEFVSIASHQLRTPLTAIKGYASMILEGSFGALNQQAREAVEKLFRSSQRLVSLVEDFLTVSRIERGKMQFDFSSVDLRVLVGGVVKELEIDAHDKGPMISFQVESENSYVVRGDILKLKQVFINVIDNAIKFTNYGFIRILLSRNEETKKIRIAVSDTGVGMDFNTILHLFKRFDEEISSNRKGKIGMSPGGLGLYVSHQIVKAHNGNIWAQSQGVGKGSTFFVELPEWRVDIK
ncbi:MAG: ATP-binding protein [bacterium]|nr:ATP-binding protein [bacterium]